MRKGKWIASIVCATVILSSAVVIFDKKAAEKAYAMTMEASTVEDSYNLGDTFELPDEVEVNIDGNTLMASEGVLISPSGVVYGKGDYELLEKGTYTLSYTFTYQNKKYTATKTFDVNDYNYRFSSNGSSASYGELSLSKTQETGLTFELGQGEKFIYESTINVYDEEWNGMVDVCKIYPNFRSYNETTGLTYDTAHWLLVKMVDCYDESNYLEFYTTMNPASNFYCGAGASYQNLAGLESIHPSNATPSSVKFDGNFYKLNYAKRYPWQQWQYGTYTYTDTSGSGAAMAQSNLVSAGGINFQYEPETNKIYRKAFVNGTWKTQFVNDLDEPIIYGNNFFKGFTTGEVYLTIECDGYTGSETAEVQVVSLFGNNGETLQKSERVDTTKPMIQCDVEWTDNGGIYLAKDEEYVLPQVKVLDVNFAGDLKTQVYYNYGEAEQSLVYVKDGTFTPTRVGKYTAVYTATDLYGNQTKYFLPLNSIDRESITYTIPAINALEAGKTCVLPEAVVDGINKDLNVEIVIIAPNGERVKLKDGAFEPKQVGAFTITYILSDNVYEKEYTYTVACTNENNNICFYDEISEPKYFIKGASYAIDDYFAYTINEQGLVAHVCDVYVSVDGGEYTQLSKTDREEYKITGNATLQFKYVYQDEEKLGDIISVIDVNYGANKVYTNYFLGNYTVSYDRYIRFMVDGTNETEKIEFINPLSFADFEAKFEITQGFDAFSAVNVYAIDYLNEEERLKITFARGDNGNLVYSVNDKALHDLDVSFVGTQWIWYDESKHSIVSNQDISIEVEPFSSGLCYFSFEYVDIQGASGIALDTLNGQKFKEKISEGELLLQYERIEPVYSIGETVVIPPASCTHVFNPVLYKDITLTVFGADNKPIKDNNGLLLENVTATKAYEITFNAYGTYLIVYNAKATTGGKTVRVSDTYGVNVLDDAAPTVQFEGIDEGTVITLAVGEKHTIAKYFAMDNMTELDDMYVVVEIVTKTEQLVQYDVGESFVFEKSGEYIVRVVCFDGNWNMSTDEYVVIVK